MVKLLAVLASYRLIWCLLSCSLSSSYDDAARGTPQRAADLFRQLPDRVPSAGDHRQTRSAWRGWERRHISVWHLRSLPAATHLAKQVLPHLSWHMVTCTQGRNICSRTRNPGFNCSPSLLTVLLCFFSYECFSISCEMSIGATKICDSIVSENISTSLSLGNKIRCNRK